VNTGLEHLFEIIERVAGTFACVTRAIKKGAAGILHQPARRPVGDLACTCMDRRTLLYEIVEKLRAAALCPRNGTEPRKPHFVYRFEQFVLEDG
jgi:hypothetical protein